MIAPHAHTPCDTFLWSVGGREVFSYETEIGERWRGTIGAYLTRPGAGLELQDVRFCVRYQG